MPTLFMKLIANNCATNCAHQPSRTLADNERARGVLSERTRWMQTEAVLFALNTFKGYSDVLVCSNIKREPPILKFSSNAFHGIKVTQV